jgi:serine/threonine protein kinase
VFSKANILVNKHGHACLADFGLITITSDFTHSTTSSSTNHGTTRWMSPELLNPGQLGSEDSQPTKESDCYALGMVIYEVLSKKVPFSSYDRDFIVSRKVIEGERPRRPLGTARAWFTDNLWIMLEQCWLAQPQDRPTTQTVLGHMEQILKTWQPLPPSISQGHSPLMGGQVITGTSVDQLVDMVPAIYPHISLLRSSRSQT